MNIDGLNLFPLKLHDVFIDGYYMDSNGEVYSQKTGTLRRLVGSSTPSGRYYTLNGRSVRADFLHRIVKKHKDFAYETSPSAVLPKAAAGTKPVQREHASTLAEGITARGFVLALVATVQGEETLIFGSRPKVHMTRQSADDELQRLATLKPGTKYIMLKIEGGVVLGGLTRL